MGLDRERRRRRKPEEARRVILDAAQKRLTAAGPEAVRLQAVAADVGISHPAILHHFGSREGLLSALETRAMQSLRDDLLQPHSTGEALDRVFETLGNDGHARLLAWWTLSRALPQAPDAEDTEPMLRHLADSYHRERSNTAHDASIPPPAYEDTVFAVRLAAVALFGEALIGPLLNRSAGLDDEAGARFRRWLAELFERSLA